MDIEAPLTAERMDDKYALFNATGDEPGMKQLRDQNQEKAIASEIDAEIRALPRPNTPGVRAVRRKYSRVLQEASPEFVLRLGRELLETYAHRWVAYELIHSHKGAFQRIGAAELEELGRGIDSWWSVDAFARILAGPAWLHGQAPDALIYEWAHSEDRWWRRAALVSTVALNVRSQGGTGDVRRTLQACRLLVDDHDDMVVKAMSWALRELVPHDPDAVRAFLGDYEHRLAAHVKREVRNKLRTGLKNPGGRGV
jgi:3-methyladenine DNA glycosylase AlkD